MAADCRRYTRYVQQTTQCSGDDSSPSNVSNITCADKTEPPPDMSFRGSAASRGIFPSCKLYLVLVILATWWIPPLRFAPVGMTMGDASTDSPTVSRAFHAAPRPSQSRLCRASSPKGRAKRTFLRIRPMLRQGFTLSRGGLIGQGLRPDSFPGGEAFSPAPCVFWSPGAPPRQWPGCRRPHRTRWYRYHRWRAFRRRFCFQRQPRLLG